MTQDNFSMGGRLEGGPYAVGFRTEWRTDAARLYRASWEPEANPRPKRPILLAVWYPASAPMDAPRMRRHEYFELSDGDETIGRFRERYLPFCRATALQEVMDNYRGPQEELAPAEQIAREELVPALVKGGIRMLNLIYTLAYLGTQETLIVAGVAVRCLAGRKFPN